MRRRNTKASGTRARTNSRGGKKSMKTGSRSKMAGTSRAKAGMKARTKAGTRKGVAAKSRSRTGAKTRAATGTRRSLSAKPKAKKTASRSTARKTTRAKARSRTTPARAASRGLVKSLSRNRGKRPLRSDSEMRAGERTPKGRVRSSTKPSFGRVPISNVQKMTVDERMSPRPDKAYSPNDAFKPEAQGAKAIESAPPRSPIRPSRNQVGVRHH